MKMMMVLPGGGVLRRCFFCKDRRKTRGTEAPLQAVCLYSVKTKFFRDIVPHIHSIYLRRSVCVEPVSRTDGRSRLFAKVDGIFALPEITRHFSFQVDPTEYWFRENDPNIYSDHGMYSATMVLIHLNVCKKRGIEFYVLTLKQIHLKLSRLSPRANENGIMEQRSDYTLAARRITRSTESEM
jgi:hypothetical protein